MDLLLKRTHSVNKATLGELHINGNFFCFTLEDLIRDVKIKHETAIPAGKYEVIINFSERFKTLMPLLLNVPNYVGIRIHPGNTHEDTSGCILVGSAIQRDNVLHSKATYQALVTQIKNALRKEKVFITVENIPQPIVVQIPVDTIPVNSLPVDVEKVIVKPDTVLTQIIEVPTIRKQGLIEKILAFILSLLKRK